MRLPDISIIEILVIQILKISGFGESSDLIMPVMDWVHL
jgi:hypothetical protein